jgi:nitroreductase
METDTIATIKSRRVVRSFTAEPISRDNLETIVEAARWAPSASNSRLQKFIVIQMPTTIQSIRALAPGMGGHPTALVVICTDWQKAQAIGLPREYCGPYIDVGTAAENMLLAAHALGLGAGPVTSYSKEALQVLLDLPNWLSPDMIICLGHTAPDWRSKRTKPATRLHWEDLTYWERFEAD